MTERWSPEREYEERMAWRKQRWVENLNELSEIAQIGGNEGLKAFPRLLGSRDSGDPKDALGWSILMLWLEATECYTLGLFQACILTCGAAAERSLKLEYEKARGEPPRGKPTLGMCIGLCEGIVAPEILDFAREILDPRNDRAHALLEHSDPQASIMGGLDRGIDWRGSSYIIEPYRGDARSVITATFKILHGLYGPA